MRLVFVLLLLLSFCPNLSAGEGEIVHAGKTPQRNNVFDVKGLPHSWNPGEFERRTGKWTGGAKAENIRWVAKLGDTSYGSPVVSGGRVFIATNNKSGHLAKYPPEIDLGVLLALDAETGKLLWQYSSEKLSDGNIDWPEQGICSTPAVEGDRLWIVNNRCEIVCIKTDQLSSEAVPLWKFDMVAELGVVPHHATSSSPLLIGDYICCLTSNGVDPGEKAVVNPKAPSFVIVHKNTGKFHWSDIGPGAKTLDGQWSSPLAFEKDEKGITQIVFPAGDGWLYAVGIKDDGTVRRLWKFDCNPKKSVWKGPSSGDRNYHLGTPVAAEGLLYAACGRDPESGEGSSVLWCIDPGKIDTKIIDGQFAKDSDSYIDLSEKLADDRSPAAAENIRDNPLSISKWSYRGREPDSKEFEDRFRRSLGSPVVCGGLCLLGDFAGVVHCLDAKSGELHWTYDMMSTIWGNGLIADDRYFLGDSDGDLAIFTLSKEFETPLEINMNAPIYAAPTIEGKKIFISTNEYLFCVE